VAEGWSLKLKTIKIVVDKGRGPLSLGDENAEHTGLVYGNKEVERKVYINI
jgi:hypothetical protein